MFAAASLARAARPAMCRVAATKPWATAIVLGQGGRTFSAAPLQATATLYEDVVNKSVKLYEANKAAVDSNLDAELASNKLVLFMSGTPDAPKSEPALNVVKMLTQAQVVNFLSIDTLAHPAIMGYAVSKSGRRQGPLLFKDGKLYADYEGIMGMYKSGTLASTLGTKSTLSTGTFADELPVATY